MLCAIKSYGRIHGATMEHISCHSMSCKGLLAPTRQAAWVILLASVLTLLPVLLYCAIHLLPVTLVENAYL